MVFDNETSSSVANVLYYIMYRIGKSKRNVVTYFSHLWKKPNRQQQY